MKCGTRERPKTDRIACPWLMAIGTGGLQAETDDQTLLARASFVHDAPYARGQLDAARAEAP